MGILVLVVEDEPSILVFVEEALVMNGFDVISARNAGEALNMLASSIYEIGAMVCDIRLGNGLDGWEIARCAREINPALAIIYSTGDSAAEWNSQKVVNTFLLQKPYSASDLVDLLNTMMSTETGKALSC